MFPGYWALEWGPEREGHWLWDARVEGIPWRPGIRNTVTHLGSYVPQRAWRGISYFSQGEI